jgi:hypothetical protein
MGDAVPKQNEGDEVLMLLMCQMNTACCKNAA